MITEVNRTVIKLAGYFADISASHRVVLNTGEVFDITSADVDSLGIMSHLTCVARTPTAEAGE
jgi:hypothetical protein